MSGKFCAVCLGKYVRLASLRKLVDCCDESQFYLLYLDICVQYPIFPLL